MEKKIVNQMFADIVSKDNLRPTMMGIHFEDERCYATDTHILAVYHQSDSRFAGKTLSVEGEEIKGPYPNVDRVIPTEMPEAPLDINLNQLYKALKWHKRQKSSNADDAISFGEVHLNIGYLYKLFNLISVAGELSQCKFTLNAVGRPCMVTSPSITAMIMPVQYQDEVVDNERLWEGDRAILSYETVINNYAFNGWKPEAKKEKLAWL